MFYTRFKNFVESKLKQEPESNSKQVHIQEKPEQRNSEEESKVQTPEKTTPRKKNVQIRQQTPYYPPSQSVSPHEFQSKSGHTSRVSDYSRERLPKNKPNPKSHSKPSSRGGSWITPYIQEYFPQVLDLFSSYSQKSELVEAFKLKDFLRELLKLFKVNLKKGDLFLFDRMVENRYRNYSEKQRYQSLGLSQSVALIEEWAQKEAFKKVSLGRMLENSIQEYTQLKDSTQDPDLTQEAESILKGLKEVRQSYLKNNLQDNGDSFLKQQIKGVKEVFLFYAKQHQMLGRTPTFESINKDSELWNIGKFIKFCNDFGLTGRNKSYPTISKTQAQQLFKKFSSNSRVMSLNQFFECLESVAVLFFNSNFDLTTGEKISELSVEEKKQKLYLFLEVHDPNAYLNKAKGFGLPFSSDKLSRIPENDLSKRYKFRDHSQAKKRLQEWKENKQTDRSFSVSKKKVKYQMPKIVKRDDLVTWQDLHTKKQPNLLDKEDLMQLFTEDDCKEIFSKK